MKRPETYVSIDGPTGFSVRTFEGDATLSTHPTLEAALAASARRRDPWWSRWGRRARATLEAPPPAWVTGTAVLLCGVAAGFYAAAGELFGAAAFLVLGGTNIVTGGGAMR